jgi:hypothetical protein
VERNLYRGAITQGVWQQCLCALRVLSILLLANLAATYLVLLLVALALTAVAFMQEERRRRLGWLTALILFVYAYNLASCLEVAIVHSLANPRYTTVQMFVTILAQFLTTVLLLEILLRSQALVGRKWKITSSQP